MKDVEDLFIAVILDDRKVLDVLAKDKSLLECRDESNLSLLATTIQRDKKELALELLKLGADPNLGGKGEGDALVMACDQGNYDYAKLMLDHGANPNLGRALVAAVNIRDKQEGLKIAQLLIDHGINVNRVFRMFGEENNRRTALDFASDPDMIALLKKHGAKSIKELPADVPSDD